MFHGPILKAVRKELPKLTDAVHQEVELLNKLLNNKDDFSFMVPIFDAAYPLNLTMRTAPNLDGKTNLIKVNFDGTFFDKNANTNHVTSPSVYPIRVEGKLGNSQQVFIHQSMLASLFLALDDKFLPFKYSNANMTKALNAIFTEIPNTYGADVIEDFEAYLIAEDGSFLTLNTTTGIEIGRYNQPKLRLQIFCQNATTERELAVEFDMNLEAVLNVTLDNYFVFVHINDAKASKISIVEDKVNLRKRERIIDSLISIGIQLAVTGANSFFETPFDLKTLNPDYMPFIASTFPQPRVSAYYQDEYLYAGLSYFFDPYSMAKVDKLNVLNKYHEENTDLYLKFARQYL